MSYVYYCMARDDLIDYPVKQIYQKIICNSKKLSNTIGNSNEYPWNISILPRQRRMSRQRDGEIVAVAQEERFTRKKHESQLPASHDRVLSVRGQDFG